MSKTFDQIKVGDSASHQRTITARDVDLYAELTDDYNPMHMDDLFAAESGFGGRITHGPMIVGMAFGLASRADIMDGTVLALLEIGWKFVKPVRPGDTISAVFTVIEKRPTRAPDRGVVTLAIDVLNQHGDVAQTGTAKTLIRRKDAAGG